MLTDTTRRLALGLLGLLLLTATACGSSGDGDAGESAAGATTTTSAPADAGSDAGDGPTLEQCEAVGDVVAGGASVDDATALFPEDLQDDVAQLTEESSVAVVATRPRPRRDRRQHRRHLPLTPLPTTPEGASTCPPTCGPGPSGASRRP